MGLDITAYSHLEKFDAVYDMDGYAINPTTRQRIDEDFVELSENPHYDRADGVKGGYKAKESYSFRAGSYSGYNLWREQLAAFAGWPVSAYEIHGMKRESNAASAWDAPGGPFWELINFSDCEGTIGPKTSAKLAKDFADYQSKADSHEDEWFRSKYAEWRKAFELASQDGAVSFH